MDPPEPQDPSSPPQALIRPAAKEPLTIARARAGQIRCFRWRIAKKNTRRPKGYETRL